MQKAFGWNMGIRKVPVHAMKSHEGSGVIAPCSLNLSTGRRSAVSLSPSTHWIGRCMSCSTGFRHWRKMYCSHYNMPWRHRWKGDGELRYRSTFSLTSVPGGCEWSMPCPRTLYHGEKISYPLYIWLVVPRGQSGQVCFGEAKTLWSLSIV
jgi:hypothetical protein